MDNLINFEENDNNNVNSQETIKNLEKQARNSLFVNDRLSFELNNPFDKLEYRVTHSDDPFECLETTKMMNTVQKKEPEKPVEDLFNSLFSMKPNTDILNSTDPSPATSTTSSFIGENDSESSSSKNKTLKRCQSDSSTTSTNEGTTSRFNSVDNIFNSKTNQLLKLSLLNSPNSPLHSSSRNALDGSLIDSVCLEAKKISEKLSSYNEMSFEDLNNISQQLVDSSNVSNMDADLEQLKISFLENNPDMCKENSSTSETIEDIQEKLMRIKKEKCEEEQKPDVIEIKEEKVDPSSPQKTNSGTKSEKEVDEIFQKIKTLMKDDKKEDARKQLNKLMELLGPSEPKSLLQVQPMIRQDTFEIDTKTGKRKYSNGSNKSDETENNSNNDLMEQIAKLFGAQSLDVGSLNLSGNNDTKFVVIVPQINTPAVTPIKQNISSRRSVSFSSQRPGTTMKGIENRKLSTPMKPSTTTTSNSVRRSSFTAPRQVSKNLHPYEQKLNIGTVRKSLMGSMDKSPVKSNGNVSPKSKNITTRPPPASNVRRSVSLKNNLPSVKISEPSPVKNRPTTMAAPRIPSGNVSRSNSSTMNRRLSGRPTTTDQKVVTGVGRPIPRKTDLKAPLGTSKISSAKESLV